MTARQRERQPQRDHQALDVVRSMLQARHLSVLAPFRCKAANDWCRTAHDGGFAGSARDRYTRIKQFSIAKATPTAGVSSRQGKAGDLTLVAAVRSAPRQPAARLASSSENSKRSTELHLGTRSKLGSATTHGAGNQDNGRSATCPTKGQHIAGGSPSQHL